MRLPLFDSNSRRLLLLALAPGSLARAMARSLDAEGFDTQILDPIRQKKTAPTNLPTSAGLIIDAHFNDHQGLAFIRSLRDHGFTAPVLFLHGLGDKTTETEALAAGADVALLKPFSLDDLHTRLHRLYPDEVPAVPAIVPSARGARPDSPLVLSLLLLGLIGLGILTTTFLLHL